MLNSGTYQLQLLKFLILFSRTDIQTLIRQLDGENSPEVEQARGILFELRDQVIFYEYSTFPIEKKISDLMKVRKFLQDIRRTRVRME
jgi:hypothetical protein